MSSLFALMESIRVKFNVVLRQKGTPLKRLLSK